MSFAVLCEVYVKTNMTIQLVKNGQIPNLSCCFCPDWTAANNKERRPKNGERFKSGLEKVMAKVTLKKVT